MCSCEKGKRVRGSKLYAALPFKDGVAIILQEIIKSIIIIPVIIITRSLFDTVRDVL
jgi:hypothetical protein